MIAHVAEAGEQRGRVVLRLTSSCKASPVALDAAIRIAQAFQSEIESLFIEDSQLFELASFPFAREISFSGRARRALSAETIARDVAHAIQALQRRVSEVARAAEVPLRLKVVRDEPLRAIAAACAEMGPWNVVALAEPFGATQGEELRAIFEHVADTTGLVLVGPNARRTSGPVIVAVEDQSHLQSMLRAAERLVAAGNNGIAVLIVGESEEARHWLESQARLALGPAPGVTIHVAETTHGAAEALAEVLRRLNGGFVIGQWGGVLVPTDSDLRHLVTALECPLFLVR